MTRESELLDRIANLVQEHRTEVDRLEGELKDHTDVILMLASDLNGSRQYAKSLSEGMSRDYEVISKLHEELRQLRAQNALVHDQAQTIDRLSEDNRVLRRQMIDHSDLQALAKLGRVRIELHRDEFAPFDPNEKIPIIKRVRERYGIGLKLAKDIVDGWYQSAQPQGEEIAGADDLPRGSLPPVNS